MEKSEEYKHDNLSVNGLSLIFYSLKSFSSFLTEDILTGMLSDPNNVFKQIVCNDGYIEKMFKSSKKPLSNVVFEILGDLGEIMIPLSSNPVVSNLKFKNYLYIYEGRIAEVQSVALIDRSGISDYPCITEAHKTLTNTDIIKIIKETLRIKNNSSGKLRETIDGILKALSDTLYLSSQSPVEYNTVYSKENDCVSVQIWDIASESDQTDENIEYISGNSLVSKYKMEISAILSCHNEYFSHDNLWQKQSSEIVENNLSLEAAILNDHKVFNNDRVCLEISQINKPDFRKISQTRLNTYGYDSTSIFLTGFLNIIATGYEKCKRKVSELHTNMISTLDNGVGDHLELKHIMLGEQQILSELIVYDLPQDFFVENRHLDFFEKGCDIRKTKETKRYIYESFSDMSMLSEIILSFNSSLNGDRTTALLKSLNNMIAAQDEENKRMEILSFILGFTAVFSVSDFINTLFPQTNTWYYNLTIFFACMVLLLIIFKAISPSRKTKKADKSQGNKKDDNDF